MSADPSTPIARINSILTQCFDLRKQNVYIVMEETR